MPDRSARALALAERVCDVIEMLDELGPIAEWPPLPMTVAYQDACHLAHAQGVREQPRRLLRDIPGVELRGLAEAEICCGSAGRTTSWSPSRRGSWACARPARSSPPART